MYGAKAAIEAGADKITLPFSVSETHSQKNLRRSHQQIFDEINAIRSFIDGVDVDQRPHFEVSLSTAFGCTLEGKISEQKVIESAEHLAKLGADEVGLSDTTGYATPHHLKSLIKGVRSAMGDNMLTGVHLHNTRGLAWPT